MSILRFGSYPPASTSHYWHSYGTISTLTGLPRTQVIKLCHLLNQSREPWAGSHGQGVVGGELSRESLGEGAESLEALEQPSRGRPRKLLGEHLLWLLSERTLQEQVSLSLQARCMSFEMRFPAVGLSPSRLRQLYRGHGVRWKDMRLQYRHTEAKELEIRTKRGQAFTQLL